MNFKEKRNLNRYTFGLGTVGRDMQYSLVSMYLMVYLTEILNLPDSTMWWMTGALTILRVFDAVNDPIMGVLVDNTKVIWHNTYDGAYYATSYKDLPSNC